MRNEQPTHEQLVFGVDASVDGGDARTLGAVFSYVHDGYLPDQDALIADASRLPTLMAAADHLELSCVVRLCNKLLDERLARNDVC